MRFLTFTALATVALLALTAVPIGAASTPTATATNNTTDGLDAGDVRTVVETAVSSSPTTSPKPTATSTPTATAASTPTATPADPVETNGTRIDSQTVIVDSQYRENESVALLTIRSRATQTVTFSDAGRFREGGKVPVTVEPMRAGETATFEIPVTEVDGMVGVAISTEKTHLYAEIVKQSSGGLDILTVLSSLQAWIGGILVMLVWTVIAAYNEMRQEGKRPEVA